MRSCQGSWTVCPSFKYLGFPLPFRHDLLAPRYGVHPLGHPPYQRSTEVCQVDGRISPTSEGKCASNDVKLPKGFDKRPVPDVRYSKPHVLTPATIISLLASFISASFAKLSGIYLTEPGMSYKLPSTALYPNVT